MKNTVKTFQQQKDEHKKITMLTAYDYSTAKIMDKAGINGILIGDSLGMVMLGYEDTLSVTMEDMIHHTKAVARGAKDALIVADMPFMSYQTSIYDAVYNAGRLIKEGRAQAVKLEGGASVCPQIKAIVDASIPVMAHIGLTPQSVNAFGGFKVQGKSEETAKKELTDLGFEVNIEYDEDASKENGVVLEQSISSGATVDDGSEVTLTVNKIVADKDVKVIIDLKSITGGYTEPAEGEDGGSPTVNINVNGKTRTNVSKNETAYSDITLSGKEGERLTINISITDPITGDEIYSDDTTVTLGTQDSVTFN